MEWNLTIEHLDNLYDFQQQRCALSGAALTLDHGQNNGVDNGNASLDRIDSDVGYVVGNVQFVTKDINMGKQKLSNADFVEMCRQVALFNEQQGLFASAA